MWVYKYLQLRVRAFPLQNTDVCTLDRCKSSPEGITQSSCTLHQWSCSLTLITYFWGSTQNYKCLQFYFEFCDISSSSHCPKCLWILPFPWRKKSTGNEKLGESLNQGTKWKWCGICPFTKSSDLKIFGMFYCSEPVILVKFFWAEDATYNKDVKSYP